MKPSMLFAATTVLSRVPVAEVSGGDPLELCSWRCLGFARFTSTGTYLWSRTLGFSDYQLSLAFADEVTFVGTTLYAPNPAQPSSIQPWATLLALSPSGDELWSRRSLTPATETHAIAALADGPVVTTGRSIGGPVDYGSGPVAGGLTLAAYGVDGTPEEARSYRGDGVYDGPVGMELAGIPSGGFVYAGIASGTIDMGAGPVAPRGQGDIVVSLVDPLEPEVITRSTSAGAVAPLEDDQESRREQGR